MKILLAGILLLFGLNSCSMFFGINNLDTIKNQQALKLYTQAQEEDAKGSIGFKKAIELLYEADKIEPHNAMILHERGLIKIHSQLDIKGGFEDLQKSIDFSKDEKEKQIRYTNRGLSYMEIGDMEKACEDWTKAGKDGEYYIKEYCNKKRAQTAPSH
jgi:tetratricopeptide (TPR) repeat protein